MQRLMVAEAKADAEAKVKAHGHRVTLNNRYAPQTLSSAIHKRCQARNPGVSAEFSSQVNRDVQTVQLS